MSLVKPCLCTRYYIISIIHIVLGIRYYIISIYNSILLVYITHKGHVAGKTVLMDFRPPDAYAGVDEPI